MILAVVAAMIIVPVEAGITVKRGGWSSKSENQVAFHDSHTGMGIGRLLKKEVVVDETAGRLLRRRGRRVPAPPAEDIESTPEGRLLKRRRGRRVPPPPAEDIESDEGRLLRKRRGGRKARRGGRGHATVQQEAPAAVETPAPAAVETPAQTTEVSSNEQTTVTESGEGRLLKLFGRKRRARHVVVEEFANSENSEEGV